MENNNNQEEVEEEEQEIIKPSAGMGHKFMGMDFDPPELDYSRSKN